MAKRTAKNSRSLVEDMPEETTTRRSSRRAHSEGMKTSEAYSDRESGSKDYKSMIKELAANPAVRYVAGGIATAILTRVATNLSQRYPEISRFISENLDGIEGRLGEFKNNLNTDQANQH